MLLADPAGRKYLVTLKPGGWFHSHLGALPHDKLIGAEEGSRVETSSGVPLLAFRPGLEDYVLKMPRGAQILYPKDMGALLLMADLGPGARVVEAGAGSGALTLYLLRAVGPDGRVISYEVREDFASRALENVRAFMGGIPGNWELRVADVFQGVPEEGLDAFLLDLPEPWRAVGVAARALRPGGRFVCYLPTVVQVRTVVEALRSSGEFALVETREVLERHWQVEGQSVRPRQTMVGHTAFLTAARRLSQARNPPDGGP